MEAHGAFPATAGGQVSQREQLERMAELAERRARDSGIDRGAEIMKEPRELGGIELALDHVYGETNALDEIVTLLEQRLDKVLKPDAPAIPGGERPESLTNVGEHIQQIGDRIDGQVRRLMVLLNRVDV